MPKYMNYVLYALLGIAVLFLVWTWMNRRKSAQSTISVITPTSGSQYDQTWAKSAVKQNEFHQRAAGFNVKDESQAIDSPLYERSDDDDEEIQAHDAVSVGHNEDADSLAVSGKGEIHEGFEDHHRDETVANGGSDSDEFYRGLGYSEDVGAAFDTLDSDNKFLEELQGIDFTDKTFRPPRDYDERFEGLM